MTSIDPQSEAAQLTPATGKSRPRLIAEEVAAEVALRPRRRALIVEGFSKAYDDTPAVDDLSFDVGEGEILGLVGANGAGKTTTLRSVAGILPLKTGRVLVCGQDLVASELAAKKNLAWIPDDPQP